MRRNLNQLRDELDLLMQKLMSNERKWEMIMMMQVCSTSFYQAFNRKGWTQKLILKR